MNREQLFEQIKKKRSFLCVGLDSDILKIPAHLKETSDPIFAFNKEIIDATQDLCVAYKPNLAFSLATRISHESANSNPPPRAKPLIAAITGISRLAI